MKKIHMYALIPLVLVSMMSLNQAFSFPLYDPVIVKFGSSSEVNTAISELQSSIGNIQIIDYKDSSDLFNSLTLMRSAAEIILVGHGSNEGMALDDGSIISWQNIANWVNLMSNSEVIFLACNSANAKNFVHHNFVGFEGIIDGVLGAHSVAAKLYRNRGNFDLYQNEFAKIINRAIQLVNSKVAFSPLYVVNNPWGPYGMGWVEVTYDLGNIAMLVGSVVLTYSSGWVVPKIGVKITAGGVTLFNLLVNFLGVIFHHMSDVAMVGGALIALAPTFLDFLLVKVIPSLSFWVAGAAISDVVAQFGALTASGGTAAILKAIQILAIIAGVAWWLAGAYSDITDQDDIANMPSFIFGG